MINILVVEDSPTSRQLLVNYFEQEPDLKVVGAVVNGLEAVKIVPKIKPDIIIMDINMPIMNGFEAAKEIMEEHPSPILLISSEWSMHDVKIALEGMTIGVLGAFEKPIGPGHPESKIQLNDLLENIRILSQIKVVRRWKKNKSKDISKKVEAADIPYKAYKAVVIGASTGGPPVLSQILSALPSDYPLPILIVQHMTEGFMDHFIDWLNGHCFLNIKKAVDGEIIKPGNVYFGSDGYHMTIQRGRVKFCNSTRGESFVPSVSRLFSSAAEFYAENTVAIILTGMGRDGAAETKLLKDAGAYSIAQNEASSVVFSMAKEAINLGGINVVLSPEQITNTLLHLKAVKG